MTTNPDFIAILASLEAYATKSFGEIVVRWRFASTILTELHRFNAEVDVISFWCDCSPGNAAALGCPHGGGGYRYKSDGSYYSELDWVEPREFEDSVDRQRSIEDYVQFGIQREDFFRECLAIGFVLRSTGALNSCE